MSYSKDTTKGDDLFMRSIEMQEECLKRIKKFNSLLRHKNLTYSQRIKIISFRNNRLKIYKQMTNVQKKLRMGKLSSLAEPYKD